MFKAIVTEAGIALVKIFVKKLPLIISLLGSKAKTNEGIPIVNIQIKVS